MAKTFISYNRQDIETVKTLAQDLHDLGHSVWFDQDITGGQPWWNKILANVRECEIFVFAMTPASLASHACMQELGYSRNLGKSILPILLSDKVNVSRLPSPLNEIQFLDYHRQDKDAFKGLDKAIKSLPSPEPLPDPLPDPPPVPVSYLSTLREKIETTKLLSLEDQVGLVFKLKNRLEEDHFQQEADELRELLLRLRQRDDLLAKVAKDLDSVMARIDENLSPLALDREGKPPQISVRPAAAGQEAHRRVEQITAEIEVGKVYEGRVAKLMDFGAFVNILPGKDGLVHISQISDERVQNVSDKLSEGDLVRVRVLEVDKQGRIRLSMKAIQDPVEETKETEKRTELVHTKDVHSVAFSPDGTLLASGQGGVFGFGSVVRLWRVSDGTSLRTLEGHSNAVDSVAFSPDGSMLASGANDHTVRLWRVSDGTPLRTLAGHSNWVNSVAFSPDGSMLASGAIDNTVRLWRVSDGTPLRTLEGNRVAFSPDGSMLASGAWDNTVRLWRVSDGTPLRTLAGHTIAVYSVAFSPDGSMLASGALDHTVRLWRVSDGTSLHTLGHSRQLRSVAFSPDGSMLASVSDKTVRLWRVSDGTPLRTLEGHSKTVSSVAFSPDGSMLASGSWDKTVRLWQLK